MANSRQVHGKPAAPIQPGAGARETAVLQDGVHHGGGEFVAVFGVNGFAARKMHGHAQRRYFDLLCLQALQVHFHARSHWVPAGNVRE